MNSSKIAIKELNYETNLLTKYTTVLKASLNKDIV